MWAFAMGFFSATASSQVIRSKLPVQKRTAGRAQIALYTTIKAKADRPEQKPGGTIRIRDVARVYSSDLLLRANLEALDLDSWPEPGKSVKISKSHVDLRIQLSELDTTSIVVVGPPAVKVLGPVSGKGPVVTAALTANHTLRNRLVDSIRNQVSMQHSLAADETVVVELTGKISLPDKYEPTSGNGVVQVVSDGESLIGSRQIEFFVADGTRVIKGSCQVSIIVGKKVNVATRAIPRGELVTASNVSSKLIFFKSSKIELATGAEAFGQYAGREIRPGTQIKNTDLLSASRKNSEFVVRKGTPVTAIAVRGTLTTRLKGAICMQQGRVNDVILVQNPKSKKTFAALVVSGDQVEVR